MAGPAAPEKRCVYSNSAGTPVSLCQGHIRGVAVGSTSSREFGQSGRPVLFLKALDRRPLLTAVDGVTGAWPRK